MPSQTLLKPRHPSAGTAQGRNFGKCRSVAPGLRALEFDAFATLVIAEGRPRVE